MHRFICHSGDSTLKCTPMKFGLIWRALIRSGHVLTLWIMKSSLYRKPCMRTYARARAHTTKQHLYTAHANTGTQACIHPPTKKMDRTPGGFLMTLLDFVSPCSSPLYFYLPSLLSGPQRGVCWQALSSEVNKRAMKLVVGGGLVVNPQCLS